MACGAIARDHHQWVGNHLVDHLLSIGENQHPARRARNVQLFKSFLGQVFARVWKHEIAVADTQFFLPTRIE